jgi:hypothetical protein
MFIVSILYFIYFYIIVYYIILSYIYFISTLQQNHIILLSFIYINIKFLYVYSFNIILPSVMTQFKTLCGSENHVFVPQMCRGTIFTKTTTEMIKSPKMFLVNITQIGAVHEKLICIILY